VVIGSAVYVDHWLDPAKDFVNRFRTALADRPVWLFSSRPVGDPSGKLARAMGQDRADLAVLLEATHAREHRMFAGKLGPKHLSLRQRASLLVFRGLEGDFRDWAGIRQWAEGISRQLAWRDGEGGSPMAQQDTHRPVLTPLLARLWPWLSSPT
jgi:menaquinone-dependent protoporphyrinogen oxidase